MPIYSGLNEINSICLVKSQLYLAGQRFDRGRRLEYMMIYCSAICITKNLLAIATSIYVYIDIAIPLVHITTAGCYNKLTFNQ